MKRWTEKEAIAHFAKFEWREWPLEDMAQLRDCLEKNSMEWREVASSVHHYAWQQLWAEFEERGNS